MIIAVKSTVPDFLNNLLTALQTISNMHTQVSVVVVVVVVMIIIIMIIIIAVKSTVPDFF